MLEDSLAVQRLGLQALTAKGPGSIPGQGTKIPQAMWSGQKKIFNNIIYKQLNSLAFNKSNLSN